MTRRLLLTLLAALPLAACGRQGPLRLPERAPLPPTPDEAPEEQE